MKMIDRIDRILSDRGIDQDDFERRAGLPQNRISKWKGGVGVDKIRASYALSMARELGVSVEWLIDEDAPDEPVRTAPLTPDEAEILDVIRESGLGKVEVLAALAGRQLRVPAPHPAAPTAAPVHRVGDKPRERGAS